MRHATTRTTTTTATHPTTISKTGNNDVERHAGETKPNMAYLLHDPESKARPNGVATSIVQFLIVAACGVHRRIHAIFLLGHIMHERLEQR